MSYLRDKIIKDRRKAQRQSKKKTTIKTWISHIVLCDNDDGNNDDDAFTAASGKTVSCIVI